MERWPRWLGLFLGCLLIVAGVAETIRLTRSGDGGLLFWFPTLVGGGALILAGTLLLPRRPTLGAALTVAGCIAGMLPTMWTLIVPVLLIVLAVTSVSRQRRPTAEEASGS
jgi:hypothetical protein